MTSTDLPLTILYDATVLAMAQSNLSARTGIYTVVDNLARAIAARQDVRLALLTGPHWMPQLQRALRDDPLAACLEATKTLQPGPSLNYVATYYPIPSQIEAAGISSFQIVHDLIPIIHPEWNPPGSKEMYQAIVQPLTRGSHAFCVSHHTRNDVVRIASIGSKLTSVMPLAAKPYLRPVVDQAPLGEMRRKLNIPADMPYILTHGLGEPRKNLATVLRAFFALAEGPEGADLCLVVAGTKSWSADETVALLNGRPELARRVIRVGYVADELQAPLYSDALCFVSMSLYEGFGLPCLEAMICGTPVIASNRTSLPEVVGDAGLLVEPLDVSAIADAMGRLCHDAQERQRLAQAGLRRAAEFSWEKSADHVIKVMAKHQRRISLRQK